MQISLRRSPKSVVLVIALLVLCTAVGIAAYADSPGTPFPAVAAQSSAAVTGIDGQPAGEVTVGGQVVMRIRSAMGGFTSVQRAQVVASRLQGLFQSGLTPDSIAPGFLNGEVVVEAKEGLLVTVDQATAQGNGSSRLELAVAWANNLRQSLDVPLLPWHETLLAAIRSYKNATVVKGLASWYGKELSGAKTSSDEVFNPNDFTAAHRTLPFGTRLLVLNPANGHTVVVRINDRGPHIRGRVLDISLAAARVLGIVGQGVAYVEAYVLP